MSEPRPLPDALLERYVAGDLTGESLAKVERAIAESAKERARVEELRADSAAFLIRHPPGPLAAKLEKPKRRWLLWLPLAAAAAAMLVFFIQPPVEPEHSVKGSVVLTVFRQRGDDPVERLENGATVRPGDHVRFSITAPADGFVAVISRDGAGKVSTYHPFGSQQAAPYKAKEPLLQSAIALDDVRGKERVWAVFSEKPFELAPLLRQIERGEEPQGLTAVFDWVK
ncbi:MAG: DUF4384 domain-containing protein [Archangiaceae bacterium]|nr:DUF4384 domain-containing protein [Archangiaceae bacterium]